MIETLSDIILFIRLNIDGRLKSKMNAVTSSPHDFLEDNAGVGSDSETNTDELPEYYQPISAEAGEDEEELDLFDQQNSNSDDDSGSDHRLPNGYVHCMENGVSSLDLSSDDEGEREQKEVEEDEELRMREASDVAIQRAFREDENRRTAPLTPENAVRVMEAMRGVSFAGLSPDWACRIPEDQWIDQLRQIRRPPPAGSTVED
ncbi:uncharacterized protein LOC113779726 [Coffea eugenioides]|uniref:uncharacterized protein LOC113779726 n=1 Tax=Coffea eugenioides TaxID=49369 RepID=UPI000F60778D|nr:uncharacterized protein LOC113779726 [Coffea eugenioides]